MAVVGDDAFDGGEAILHRTELGAQLRIFGAQKLDPLHLLTAVLGIDGLTPSAVERVAVLDAEQGGEHPACDTADAHEGDYRSEISDCEHLDSPAHLARGSRSVAPRAGQECAKPRR